MNYAAELKMQIAALREQLATVTAERDRLREEAEQRRQSAWWWRDVAQRVFRLWNPKGAEYDHWVKDAPELGRDYWHLRICSKQFGPVDECSVCKGRSGADRMDTDADVD